MSGNSGAAEAELDRAFDVLQTEIRLSRVRTNKDTAGRLQTALQAVRAARTAVETERMAQGADGQPAVADVHAPLLTDAAFRGV